VFGIIPAGTGNDFMRMLCIPSDIEKAANIILNNHIKAIDYAIVNNERKSLVFISYGIATEKILDVRKQKNPTHLSYTKALLKSLFHFKPQVHEVILKGEVIRYTGDFLGIHNGTYAGGGIHLCRDAVPDDGYLNLLILEHKSWIRRILNIISFMRKKLHKQPNVIFKLVKNVKVISQLNNQLCIDGELFDINEIEVKVIHKGVKFYSM
jgi:diacylglycerol kinase family enzyme